MNETNEQNPGAGRRGGKYTDAGGGFIVGYEPKGDNGEYLPVAVEVHTTRQLTDEEILPVLEKRVRMHSNELHRLLGWRRDRIEKMPYGTTDGRVRELEQREKELQAGLNYHAERAKRLAESLGRTENERYQERERKEKALLRIAELEEQEAAGLEAPTVGNEDEPAASAGVDVSDEGSPEAEASASSAADEGTQEEQYTAVATSGAEAGAPAAGPDAVANADAADEAEDAGDEAEAGTPTELPATGGASLVTLGAGALLVSGGLLARYIKR